MNKNFQNIFTEEKELVEKEVYKRSCFEKYRMEVHEIKNLMVNFQCEKGPRPWWNNKLDIKRVQGETCRKNTNTDQPFN